MSTHVNKTMRITHQHIADKLGISRTLVTSALHGSSGSRISSERRREIENLAREMGYRPRNMTTRVIACIMPSIDG